MLAWQQQEAPLFFTPDTIQTTLAFLVAPRHHVPAEDGKRRAIEAPPGLNLANLTPILTSPPPAADPADPAIIRTPRPDCTSLRPTRHSHRFAPYRKPQPAEPAAEPAAAAGRARSRTRSRARGRAREPAAEPAAEPAPGFGHQASATRL